MGNLDHGGMTKQMSFEQQSPGLVQIVSCSNGYCSKNNCSTDLFVQYWHVLSCLFCSINKLFKVTTVEISIVQLDVIFKSLLFNWQFCLNGFVQFSSISVSLCWTDMEPSNEPLLRYGNPEQHFLGTLNYKLEIWVNLIKFMPNLNIQKV